MTIVEVRADALLRALGTITVEPQVYDSLSERALDPSFILIARPEGASVIGIRGHVVVRAPVADVTVEEPGIVILPEKVRDRLRSLTTQRIRFESRHLNEEAAVVTSRNEGGGGMEHRVERAWEHAYREDLFSVSGRSVRCSAAVLRRAVDVALGFVSLDEGDMEMRLGGITLLPGRVVATDGKRAIIIESRGLPGVTAWLRADAVRPLVRFLKGQGELASVSSNRERVRITAPDSEAEFVIVGGEVRTLDLTLPSGAPVLAFEASARDLARTVGYLKTARVQQVRATVSDDGGSFGFEHEDADGASGYGPAFGATWTGSSDGLPPIPLAALEGVVAGLKAGRGRVEFRLIGNSVLLTSEERVVFDKDGKSKKKPVREVMTITRCVACSSGA